MLSQIQCAVKYWLKIYLCTTQPVNTKWGLKARAFHRPFHKSQITQLIQTTFTNSMTTQPFTPNTE